MRSGRGGKVRGCEGWAGGMGGWGVGGSDIGGGVS